MALWLSISILFLCVTGLILRPILRPVSGDQKREDDSHLLVYKDQLSEIQKDIRTGSLNAEDGQAMEVEVRRNLLAAARRKQQSHADALSPAIKNAAIATCVLITGVSFLVYLDLGHPDMPNQPLALRNLDADNEAQSAPPQMQRAIDGLLDALEQDPDNLDGWVSLSRAYLATSQPIKAITALRTALDLAPRSNVVKGDLAAALTQASQGVVGEEAQRLFEEILRADPSDPRARYFAGLFTAQSGDLRGALAMWRGLAADSPFDAPWMPAVQSSIKAAAESLGINEEDVEPQRVRGIPRAPKTADIEAIQALTTQEREEMVNSMVAQLAERLKDEPENIEGWVRLIRSYGVLNRREDAQNAFKEALAIHEGNDRLLALGAELGLNP